MAGVPIVVATGLLLSPPWGGNLGSYFPRVPLPDTVAGWQIGLALGLHLLTVAVLYWILESMRRLFRLFSAGEALSPLTAVLIRRIGLGLVVMVPARIVVSSLTILVLTLSAPPGERMLSIGIGDEDVWLLLAGGLMAVIGWAMAEAAAAAQENREFV